MQHAIGAIAVSLIAGLAAGCTQMTRHSNTMIFGTNTQFGISAGTDATSVPSVNVGYRRQEAVVMPLIANKADDKGNLVPMECQGADKAEGCLLTSKSDGGDPRIKEEDTYSVLASFGATFGGSADGGGASASGGLAQYFATGLAARKLAEAGGAALVATGEAAKESARAAGNVRNIPTTAARVRFSRDEIRDKYNEISASQISDEDKAKYLECFNKAAIAQRYSNDNGDDVAADFTHKAFARFMQDREVNDATVDAVSDGTQTCLKQEGYND